MWGNILACRVRNMGSEYNGGNTPRVHLPFLHMSHNPVSTTLIADINRAENDNSFKITSPLLQTGRSVNCGICSQGARNMVISRVILSKIDGLMTQMTKGTNQGQTTIAEQEWLSKYHIWEREWHLLDPNCVIKWFLLMLCLPIQCGRRSSWQW